MSARTPSSGHGRRDFFARVGGTAAAAALTGVSPAALAARDDNDDRARSTADEVIQWNQVMTSGLLAAGRSPQDSVRIGAIVQAAVFDAVNGIDRRFTPYFVNDPGPRGASARAAAVQAAYVALKALLPPPAPAPTPPSLIPNLERQRDASIAAIRERGIGPGVGWGELVANALLNERSTDGFPNGGTQDLGENAPGKWRPAVAGTPAIAAWLAVLPPFCMTTPDQFRPEGPPSLTSAAYASDVAEVQAIGRATGSTRTPAQTVTAVNWTDNTVSHWNKVAVTVALTHERSLSQNARLFAWLNIAMADGGIGIWDAKFFYRFWRPISAITLADTDGNAATTPDPGWTPLIPTPNHQEYPSGHSGLSGAAARVLARVFGDRTTFTHATEIAPFAPRTHRSFSSAADEANESRIYGGIHFRTAVRHGRILGDNVGRLVVTTLLQRL